MNFIAFYIFPWKSSLLYTSLHMRGVVAFGALYVQKVK
jgi:hypothetical protein